MKNVLCVIGGILMVALIFAATCWGYYNLTQAQNKNYPTRTISISASGQVYAKPDIAKVYLSVINDGSDLNKLQEENNLKMKKAIDFLKGNGVLEEDIQTSAYNLNPQYDYTWCQKKGSEKKTCSPKIISYELRQQVMVKIRDFEKIDVIVGGLSGTGINEISNLDFGIDDSEIYKNEAKIKAINKIQERSKLLSQQTGIRLGNIINISESYDNLPYTKYDSMGGGSNVSESAPVPTTAPVLTGQSEVSATVTITYEIK
ncbi:MAG: SIMPL domain-containing protein [Candidatus Parcubacteria bacterium]|nr:SIMPL domain-containing protein [Candidatus Parcubacteria bacterium]